MHHKVKLNLKNMMYLIKVLSTPKQNKDNFATLLVNRNNRVMSMFLDIDAQMIKDVLGYWHSEQNYADGIGTTEWICESYDINELDREQVRQIANRYHKSFELYEPVSRNKKITRYSKWLLKHKLRAYKVEQAVQTAYKAYENAMSIASQAITNIDKILCKATK